MATLFYSPFPSADQGNSFSPNPQSIIARNGTLRANNTFNDELTGIVIDETFTNLARDFSHGFSQIWRNQPTNIKYSVTLKESQSALRGNMISITFRRQMLYMGNLNRRKDNIELGREAAKSVIRKLKLFKPNPNQSPDLAADEF